jgi:hypothetical protein
MSPGNDEAEGSEEVDRMTEAAKPDLSNTQMDMASKCMEQYRRRYLERERIPPGFALVRGGAVHSAAEVNLRQKIQSGADLPVKDVVEIAEAAFETRTQGGILLDPDEQSRGLKIVKGEARDATVRLARLHAIQQAPALDPIAVEETIRVELPGLPRDFLGVIDVVSKGDRLADLKTTTKAKQQEEADQSNQLSGYSFIWKVKTGIMPKLSLDVLVDTGSSQRRQVLETTRDDQDLAIFGRKFVTLCDQLEAGVFAPAPVGVWWCSGKYCGYHASCPFVRPGKRTQGD